MKELFRFTSIRKFEGIKEPCGKINIDNAIGKYYSQAVGASTREKFDSISEAFFKSAFNKNPLSVNRHLSRMYERLTPRKKYSVEEIEDICRSTYGNGVAAFVADQQFQDAKNIIVENVYFLIQKKHKEYSGIKILYKRIFKIIGLLEAVAAQSVCLEKILANPSLQYYSFQYPVGDKMDNGKDNKDEVNDKKFKEELKNDYDHILMLKETERELLSLHAKLKNEFILADRQARVESVEPTVSKRLFSKLFGTALRGDGTKKRVAIQNPMLAGENDLSANALKVFGKLGIDHISFEPLTVINRIDEEIVSKSNTLNSILTKPRFISYQGKSIPSGRTNKFAGGISMEARAGFLNWLNSNSYTFDVPQGSPAVPLTRGFAKILGEGRLMRVEEEYKGCQVANLSAVVSIPPNSKKEYKNRYLTKVISTTESETSSDTADETSTESREQNNMSSESEKIQKFDMSLQAGVSVSASYGPTVGVEVSSDFSTSVSNSETTNSASSYAKDVTSRAVKKIEQRIRALQRTERTTENESIHIEGFDNPNAQPSVGIYQWINEVYEAKLVQYDARLQLEFMVPEPGNLLLYASNPQNAMSGDLVKPEFNLTVDEIDAGTYKDFVAQYRAADVTSPPPPSLVLTKAFTFLDAAENDKLVNFAGKDDTIAIPEGYRADLVRAFITASRPQKDNANAVSVTICHDGYTFNDPRRNDESFTVSDRREQFVFDVKADYRNIPIAITGYQDRSFTLTVVVYCIRQHEALDKWKMETFTKLNQAYQKQLDDYNDKLALSRQRSFLTGSLGNNPDKNRAIEKDELKRASISILTNQSFELFDSINDSTGDIPTIDFNEVKPEGEYIRFFENAFEWTQMTYVLYPYFWGNPGKTWLRSLKIGLDDPRHEEFLKSGCARVVVPVRPEFNAAILKYLENGDLWDGENPDDIDIEHSLFVPVWREIMERQGALQQQPEIEDTWQFTLPTNIQIITNGLPTPLPRPFI